MELSLIEYLENKGFEAEEIVMLERKSMENDSYTNIKKYESIYKIFEFANITDYTINKLIVNNPGLLTINKLIVNNPGLLNKSDLEIIKIAYVWNKTGVLFDVEDKKRSINAENINRTFLRNEYLNTSIRMKNSPISFNALVMGDKNFQDDYFGFLNGKSFYPSYENLLSLWFKDEGIKNKEKHLNEYLSQTSLKWYLDLLRKKKEMQNGSRSI